VGSKPAVDAFVTLFRQASLYLVVFNSSFTKVLDSFRQLLSLSSRFSGVFFCSWTTCILSLKKGSFLRQPSYSSCFPFIFRLSFPFVSLLLFIELCSLSSISSPLLSRQRLGVSHSGYEKPADAFSCFSSAGFLSLLHLTRTEGNSGISCMSSVLGCLASKTNDTVWRFLKRQGPIRIPLSCEGLVKEVTSPIQDSLKVLTVA
jgi:hypothetical protein